MMKLKYNEVSVLRGELLKKNKDKCPICKEKIVQGEAALDHCHKTGHIRNTVHRDCNILLGKIENYIGRYGKRLRNTEVLDVALSHIVEYMTQDYTENPFHPTHRTEEDKQVSNWRQRMKKAKRKETKDKYKKLIQEFKVQDTKEEKDKC
jgi:hypothetical protein